MTDRLPHNIANYTYTVKLSLTSDSLDGSQLRQLAPSGQSAIIDSDTFKDYKQCIDACNALLGDLSAEFSANTKRKHVVNWEYNPMHVVSRSKKSQPTDGWESDDVMRMYVIDQVTAKKTKQLVPPVVAVIKGRADNDLISLISSMSLQ